MRYSSILLILVTLGALSACSLKPQQGPDKQFASSMVQAAAGAGAGAVTGFQLGSGSGPGAAVGAGLGFAAGAIGGVMQDATEAEQARLRERINTESERALAHRRLADHYRRRLELHPTRDIYPADWFFHGDSSELCEEAKPLIEALARINKDRLPYSELVVVAYVKSKNPESRYARFLAEERAEEIVNFLTRYGLEPRRLTPRPVVLPEPILVDPDDDPFRYNQAIEFIAADL